MYTVQRFPYSGLYIGPTVHETLADARADVADRLRATRRRGRAVQTLSPGKHWEIIEPDDAAMVPDWAGTLSLLHVTFECRECGSQCETESDARECCAYPG